MPAADINIRIGADITDLRTQLAAGTISVKNFTTSAAQIGPGMITASKEINNLGSAAKGSVEHISKTQKALEHLTSSDDIAAHSIRGLGRELLHIGPALAFTAIAAIATELIQYADTLLGATEAQKRFNEVMEGGKKGYVEAASSVMSLQAEMEDLNKGIGNQDDFLKHYNETLGKTIGKTDDLKTAEKNVAEYAQTYITAMFFQSVANLAFQKSAEKAFEALTLQHGSGVGMVSDALEKLRGKLSGASAGFQTLGKQATEMADYFKGQLPRAVEEVKVKADVKIYPHRIYFDLPSLKDGFTEAQRKMVDELDKEFNSDIGNRLGDKIKFKVTPTFDSEATKKNIAEFLKKIQLGELMQKQADELNKIVKDDVISSISSMADALAAIATGKGGIGDLFSGIFTSLGGMLKDLGKYFIQTGIEVGVFKKSLAAHPALAVAAGFALELLGSVVQAGVSKHTGFATGGSNIAGGFYDVGERGRERVFLPQGSSVMPNAQLNASAGQQVFIPNAVIRGTDIVISYTRQMAQNSRNAW